MLHSLGTAILSLYGLFIGISALVLLGLFFGKLPEWILGTIYALARPLIEIVYRNAPEEVIETKCQQLLGVAVAALVMGVFLFIGNLLNPGFLTH